MIMLPLAEYKTRYRITTSNLPYLKWKSYSRTDMLAVIAYLHHTNDFSSGSKD